MPYRLQWEPRGVYREYIGDMTIAERLRSFEDICRDRRFDDLRYVITDYSTVASYEITASATAEIAALHIAPLRTNPHIVIAAVTTRADIVAAIEDFKSYDFTSAPYQVFPTLEDARRWASGWQGPADRSAAPGRAP